MLNRPLPWTVCIIITLVAGCGGYPSNTTDTTLVTPSVDVTPSPQLIVSADPTHTLPTVFMDFLWTSSNAYKITSFNTFTYPREYRYARRL